VSYKKIMFHVPEQYRITTGRLASSQAEHGNNGAFSLPPLHNNTHRILLVIASDGRSWAEEGLPLPAWEHVSVHAATGPKPSQSFTPTWAEMCYAKKLFWDLEDTVIQFHPPQSQYINWHEHTLHLWRPIGVELPLPPTVTIA
jgi:hypothetical protein